MRLNRRHFLSSTGALVGSAYFVRAMGAPAPILDLDFRGGIPQGVAFKRASSATVVDNDSQLRQVGENSPRFPLRAGRPQGLLIEGEAKNLIKSSCDLSTAQWGIGGDISRNFSAGVSAPDGSKGVFHIGRPEPKAGSECVCSFTKPEPPVADFLTASIWLRSDGNEGKWRLRLMDFKTYNNKTAVVDVGPEWRRYSIVLTNQLADTGVKRFSIIQNEPTAANKLPTTYLLNERGRPANTPLTLNGVYAWGAQSEQFGGATSLIVTRGEIGLRAADEVTTQAKVFNRAQGRLTIELPEGGRHGGILIDAAGDASGLRLGYTNSGWIFANIGKLHIVGFGDVSQARFVQIEWSSRGLQLSTGDSLLALSVQAASKNAPHDMECGEIARLGMTTDGLQPLGRPIARLLLEESSETALALATPPKIIPARYKLVFGDDFNDNDVSRINENATGGRIGAPAWRSRYRQDRMTVINKEKQIYMDSQFAGSAEHALGVQPFSIANSVLRIKADRADPVSVSPYIGRYAYTSGCITTELTHWQTYGYFEMSARLPRGKGYWPAFWLLPKRAAWPPEIDVFEGSGTRPYSFHCGMFESHEPAPAQRQRPIGLWIDMNLDTTDGFHHYAVEWSEDNLAIYFDGLNCFEYGPHGVHEDMYLLANLAVGSHDPNWIPDPDDSTPFPGFFEIDYINAYRRG